MKTTTLKYLILLMLLTFTGRLFSQQYIYITHEGIRKFLRVGFGPSSWTYRISDSTASHGYGLHVANEAKIISGFTKMESKFAVHDAFYLDLTMGMMKGLHEDSQSGVIAVKSVPSILLNFGYLAALGYRTERWAAMGGMDFRYTGAMLVDHNSYGFFLPAGILRGELALSKENFDKRMLGMIWITPKKQRRPVSYFGARIEMPLGKGARWWLCGQYGVSSEKVTYTATMKEHRTSLSQAMIGFRIHGLP